MTHQYLMPRLARNDERVAYLRFPVELGATMDSNRSRLPGIEVPRAFKFVWPRDVTIEGDFPVGSVKRLDLLPDDFESSFIFEPCISPKIRFASAEDLDKGMSYRNLDDPERKETSTFFVLLEARYLEEVSEEEARTLPPIADTLAQDVCHTIAGHILGAYASTQPYFWHYGVARIFLEKTQALTGESKDEDAVLALATALCRTCSQLREKIRGMHQAHAGAEPTIYLEGDEGIPKEELERAHEERAERQREHHEAWVRRLEEPLPLMDGMLAQDSALLELLDEIGAPSEWLEKASARAKKRCAANADLGFDVWEWWFTPVEDDHPEGQGRMRSPFVEYLLWGLWPGIKEQLDKEHKEGAPSDISPVSLLGLHHKGSNYGQLDRVGSAAGAWSGGTSGRVVRVDDHDYEHLPFLLVYENQAEEFLKDVGKRPHQQQLKIHLPNKRPKEPGQADTAMTHSQFLTYVFALQATPKKGYPVKQSLDDFIRAIKPGIKRIRKRDREEAMDALARIGAIRLESDGTIGRMFDIVSPTKDHPDRMIEWRWGLKTERVYESLGGNKAFEGWSTINRDAFYGFTGNQSAHARLYAFLCSMWNDAKDIKTKRFSVDAVPTYSIETLCLFTGMFNEHALSYMRGENENHTHHGRAKMKMRELLDELAKPREERPALLELEVIKEKRGVMEEVKVLPTSEHIEAMERMTRERVLMDR